MVTSYSFRHEGRPKVKERPRSGPNSRRLYTPKTTLDAQADIAASYDGPMFDGLVVAWMEFHPTYTLVTLEDWDGEPSSVRGDWDNLGKLVTDALEGVAYENDRQVIAGHVLKAA